jgi:hypothetical protein
MEDQFKPRILEIYKICVEEEHYFLAEHQKRVAFYTGLISAILTLTIGGFLEAPEWYQFAVLALGGILLFAVSGLAKSGTRRMYQRFLETVTTRGKLEYELGFSEERGQLGQAWVQREPYSPLRHLESRHNSQWQTSRSWVDYHLDKKENYQGVSRRLFSITLWVGIGLIAVAILLASINICDRLKTSDANKALQPTEYRR